MKRTKPDPPIKVVKEPRLGRATEPHKDWEDAPRRIPCGGGFRVVKKGLSK